ncbi:MAG: methyltransferase domain-containing protein [Chloroflexi bacterium]|nr:methyltransferase domain-containing protein [Chloroflexota bacterium]
MTHELSNRQSTWAGFRNVDVADDPAALVGFLDKHYADPELVAMKRRSFALLDLPKSGSVLDAGCGTGMDVLAVAGGLGPHGRAIGVDRSETMIAQARKRAAGTGLPVEFHVGDVAALPLPDDVVDGCHAERVLIHVDDPRAVLAEFRRVTRPGGRLSLCEIDYGSAMRDHPDRAVTRRIDQWVEDVAIRHGWMGRQLPRLAREAGLTDITVFTHVRAQRAEPAHGYVLDLVRTNALEAGKAGAITAVEAADWIAEMDRAVADGTWFQAVTFVLIAARNP